MANHFKFLVEITVERREGKFTSRDDIQERLEQAIQEGVDGADLGGLGADGTSVYEMTDSSVSTY